MYINKPPEIFQEVRELLEIIPVVNVIQLKIYIKKIMPNLTDDYIKKSLKSMKEKQLIFTPVKGYVSSSLKLPKNTRQFESFFWTYLALMDDEKMPLSKGRYPADYIMVSNNNIIEVILFSNNGQVKLNFLKHRNNDPSETMVLIILENQDKEVIPENLKPFEQHQIITVYNNEGKSIPKFDVSNVYEMRSAK